MMALVGSSMVGSGLMVGGLALILDIHHVARVTIGSVVGHNLGAAVREEDMVAALCGIAITGLFSTEVNVALVGILGIDTILVSVMGLRVFVLGLVVAVAMVLGCGGMVGRLVVNGSMVGRFVVNGGVVDRSMVHRSMNRAVVGYGHSSQGSNKDEVLKSDVHKQ